ncbi:AraC family transcriptional regulator [Leptospira sp. 201903071]|uniref:AraC family transcriptional regulator n=1 Tax=Leptospira ainazelensis TaxID=2810034 RepID=UPI001966A45B|nr:helix-turn-helix domain-containing protein [Leptospira ainazelensis]MBM9499128.1 AraC family transcriptional regulator [Leptospira ainazelensis]
MNLDFGSFAIVGGLLQSILLSLFFFRLKQKGNDSRYLGWAFLHLSLLFGLGLGFQTGWVLEFPHLSRVGFPLGALAAPIFAIALQKYFGYPKDKIWTRFSFLAPLILFLYSIPHYLLSPEEKLKYILEDRITPHAECIRMSLATLLSNIVIFGRIYVRLGELGKEFPASVFREIFVFRKFVILCVILLLFSFFLFLIDSGFRAETISNAALSFWVIGFAWFRVYAESSETVPLTLYEKEEFKYKKSLLSEESVHEIGERIFKILNSKESYLDSEFDLGSLAEELGISTHTVSQAIGRYFQKSFLELCREYRIRKAKELLKTTDHPVLRVGLDAGFNSKTSFLRAFKEEEEMTPSEYRETVR